MKHKYVFLYNSSPDILYMHTTKIWGVMDVQPHTFLTTALMGVSDHIHASSTTLFPGKEPPVHTVC
jgi:hypothetical protein